MNNLKQNDFNYFNHYSPYLWKNQEGIERGINTFRDNVVEEFVKLVEYNLVDSFETFIEQTNLFDIHTKEDFKFFLEHLYDTDIGESNYFTGSQYDTFPCYKNWIKDLWSDGALSYTSVKQCIVNLNKFNTIGMDGVLDNMLHFSDKFIDLLPSNRAFNRYDYKKFQLFSEDMMFNYLQNIESLNSIPNETKTV